MGNKETQGKTKKKYKAELGNLSIDIPTGGSKAPSYGGGNAGGAGSARSFVSQPIVPSTDIHAATDSLGEITPLSGAEDTISIISQGMTDFAGELLDATTDIAGVVADITVGAVEVAGSAVGEVAEQAVEAAGEIIAGIISS